MKFNKGDIGLAPAMTMSNLVSTTNSRNNNKKVEIGTLENIAHTLIKKNKVREELFTVLPDLEFCANTATSSILAPNDLTTRAFQIDFDNIVLGSELKGTIAETIKKDINSYYKFDENFHDVVMDSLFTLGANVEAYIPEASLSEAIAMNKDNKDSKDKSKGYGEISIETAIKKITSSESKGIFKDNSIVVDDVIEAIDKINKFKSKKKKINVTSEDLTKESGLGKDSKNNKELDATKVLGIEFIDNVSNIYLSELNKKSKIKDLDNIYNKSVTTETSLPKEFIDRLFINADTYKEEKTVVIKEFNDTDRESVGRPLIKNIPMESIKPIWSGKPDNHIGYLGLLDENGDFVSQIESSVLGGNGMSASPAIYFTNNVNMKENLINKALEGLTKMTEELPELTHIHEIYSDVLHNTIVKKIQSGKLKDIGEFSKDQRFLDVMFNRALIGKKTKIIFLPASMVSYFAYDFHPNGVGQSRMDKIQVILSMRVILLFAKLMANLNNSIPRTTITGTLDKDTPDIVKAMNDIIVGSAKYHQSSLPLGATNVNDLLNWVQTAGYRYVFESEKLPDTKISYEEGSRNIKVPEDTISEMLEELSYMPFFMNKSMVTSGMEAAFATTIVSQNKLFENRIVAQQIKTEFLAATRIKKILNNDALLRNNIKNIIKNNLPKIKTLNKELLKEIEDDSNKKDQLVNLLLEKFISSLVVRIPRPTSYSEGTNLKSVMSDYKAAVEEFLNVILSEESIAAGILGDNMSTKVADVRAILMKVMMVEWINKNNYLPEMAEFLTLDEEGESNNNLLTKYTNMNNTFVKLFTSFYETNTKEIVKNEKKIEKIEEKAGLDSDENNDDEDDTSKDDIDGDTGNKDEEEDLFGSDDKEDNKDDDEGDEEEEEEESDPINKNNPDDDDENK